MSDDRRTRSLRLPYRSPLAADTLLSFLGIRAVPGIEAVRDGTYVRSVRDESGGVVVEMTPRRDHVELQISADGSADIDRLGERARRAFDLDADPATIDGALSHDPTLVPLIDRTPGIRVPGTFDSFELVVRAIFGQQVSVAGARTSLGRLVTTAGIPLKAPSGGITHLFPTPERIAELPPEAFGMPRARAETIRHVAALVASRSLDLSEREAALSTLADVAGIGRWTLDYVAMRGFHDPDAFPATDLGIRRGFESLGLPQTTKDILEHAERWRPFRAYAVMHLWTAL